MSKKNVLLVYISKVDCYDNKQIIDYYNKIKKLYKKQHIDFFYIVNVKETNIYESISISQHIKKFIISYSNGNYQPGLGPNQTWIGLQPLFDKIFINIRLKTDKILITKKIFFRFIASLCPIKTLRKKIRNIKII